jgi:hypothetical protein
MKCTDKDCTFDPMKPERRKVFLKEGKEGARAWLVVNGPHAAAYALQAEMLNEFGRKPR